MLESEHVTCAAGVPTIWTLLYQHLKEKTYDLSSLHTLLVGGSAAPRAMFENFERDFGIRVLHAWGMTETSPLGTVSRLKGEMLAWPEERQLEYRLKQGMPMAGVEIRILGESDEDLPWDGEHVGELAVRGPWIASSYYNNPEAGAAFTPDGWFRTGDMASIDRYGYVQLSDRKKDLIKRKGEWISSVDMENAVSSHPGVVEAAVVARPDPVCDELPAVLVVRRADADPPGRGPGRHRPARHASSPGGSCRCPRTSTSSIRCPRRASARSTRRSCASSSPAISKPPAG